MPIIPSLTYAGYQYDAETGLYYLNARYYDSKIARFLTEDTYTGDPNDPLSLNLYSYCYNNPIIYIDPTGHVVTQWDRDHMSADDIAMLEQITNDWNSANKAGDTDAKDLAHATAEALRDQYRNSNEVGSGCGYTYTVSGSTATMYSGDSSLISSSNGGSVNGSTYIPSTSMAVSTLQSQQVVIRKDSNIFAELSSPGKLYASAGNMYGFDLGINNDRISNQWTKAAYFGLGYVNYAVDVNQQVQELGGNFNYYEKFKQGVAFWKSAYGLGDMLYSGDITADDLLMMAGDQAVDSMVGGILYVKNNYSIMKKGVTTTKYNTFMLGYNSGRSIVELASIGLTVRGIATLAKDLVSLKGTFNNSYNMKFTQTTASPYFSEEGKFAGKTIGEIAKMLRDGQLKPSDVPITYIERDGVKLIENTRSSLALRRANVPESAWNLINKTGDAIIEAKITERLARNGLTDSGTDVLRITGEGKNASSLK